MESYFLLHIPKDKENEMRLKLLLLFLTSVLILSACGQQKMDPVTLLNHNGEEVTFPAEKPAVFFFITSYT